LILFTQNDNNIVSIHTYKGDLPLDEEFKSLNITVPQAVKEAIRSDSFSLGIPTYKLYRQILVDFIQKPARDRKKIYLKRKPNGSITGGSEP
jgi:hypothetical protein